MAKPKSLPKLIMILGYSGSGKSVVRRIFEDIGYDVIENLPHTFMNQMIKMISKSTHDERVALVISTDLKEIEDVYIAINRVRNAKHIDSEIIFLECSENELIRRYQELRRPHPNSSSGSISEGVLAEKEGFHTLKSLADLVIDTTKLSPAEIKDFIDKRYSEVNNSSLVVNFTSFGFKHGTPLDVDFLFDVRFLPNPFYIDEMRFKTGLDENVYNYVINNQDAQDYLKEIIKVLEYSFSKYKNINKNNISVGISCTGGQHRSVAIVEYLAKYFKEHYTVFIWHRDIKKLMRK